MRGPTWYLLIPASFAVGSASSALPASDGDVGAISRGSIAISVSMQSRARVLADASTAGLALNRFCVATNMPRGSYAVKFLQPPTSADAGPRFTIGNLHASSCRTGDRSAAPGARLLFEPRAAHASSVTILISPE